MDDYASPQNIIKALKAANDPPNDGGPSKIVIAQNAWKSKGAYFPNKDEVLADWLLSTLVKERANTDLILSSTHWQLLFDVLTEDGARTALAFNTAWLKPLLNRTPLGSLFTSFLDAFRARDLDEELLEQFSKPMHLLWPEASLRMNLDTQIECFTSVLAMVKLDISFEPATVSLLSAAIRTYKSAYNNSTNKKKLLNSFIEHHFVLFAMHHARRMAKVKLSSEEKDVLDCFASEVHQVVVEVLFSAPSLKSTPDPFHQLLTSEHINSNATSSLLIRTIPFLYRSYLQELRKHRNAVFGSGSNQTQDKAVQRKFRDAAFKSFVLAYQAISASNTRINVWPNLLGLVEAMDEANIVGNEVADQASVLNDIVSEATRVLQTESEAEVVNAAMKALCVFCRIEFDIVAPHLTAIVSALLSRTIVQQPAALDLLTEVISFYSKTRTLPSYLALLMDCLTSAPTLLSADTLRSNLQELNSMYITGVILSSAHLDAVARAAKTFVTPGQTPDLASLFLSSLDSAWMAFKEANDDEMDIDDEPTSERGKTDSGQLASSCVSAADRRALAYSMIARLVAAILPALPFATLNATTFSGVRARVAQSKSSSLQQAASILAGLKAKYAGWAKQAVSAAALRVLHALVVCRPLRGEDFALALSQRQMEKFVVSKHALRELVIELFRSFFDSTLSVATQKEAHTMIDVLLHYVTSLQNQGSAPLHDLLVPGGHDRGALIVWRLTLDRWLPLIDDLATEDQLTRLADLCLRICIDDDGSSCSPASTILSQSLKSASFWELSRLRDAFLSVTMRKPNLSLSPAAYATHVTAVYSLLIRAPSEFLPRAIKSELVHKCMEEEQNLTNLNLSTELEARTRLVLRLWLCTVVDCVNILDESSSKPESQGKNGRNFTISYVKYLLRPLKDEADEFVHATGSVLRELSRQIVRAALQGREDALQFLVDLLTSSSTDNLGLASFINVLVSESPNRERFSQASISSIKQLQSTLSMKWLPMLEEMTQSRPFDSESLQLLASWNAILSLGGWLGDSVNEAPLIGQKMMKKYLDAILSTNTIQAPHEDRLDCEILQLLIREIQCIRAELREQHLTLIAASYVILGQNGASDALDLIWSQLCRRLSVEEFRALLELSFEEISIGIDSDTRIQSVVHMSTMLLRHSPEGTMKIGQDHFESCIRHFNSRSQSRNINARLACEELHLVAIVCAEKPSSLRTSDVGSIWSFLAKMLSPSSCHADETLASGSILHTITAIAGSLVRLRRDLVTSTLPHFGFVLISLLRALSAPRPQLGARQFRQITDSLPWWVSTSAFLGVDEARAVARLMTSLQAKTIPRTFSPKDRESGKEKIAVALMDAFSKHAGPVLGSYINLLINPLIAVSSGMRDALEPGLFILCESMGEHGRDALMASGLDMSGRAVMKAIWRAYEKQKYTGRG